MCSAMGGSCGLSLVGTSYSAVVDIEQGVVLPGLGPKYLVLRYFGTRVPILQYSSVLSTRTFKKNLYSYLYSSTF